MLFLSDELDMEFADQFLKTIFLEVTRALSPLWSTYWEIFEEVRTKL